MSRQVPTENRELNAWVEEIAQLYLVHLTRALFPIARDEGNGGAFVEELEGAVNLLGTKR